MATIGLLGHEYDGSVQFLKVRIEDLGHKAKIINFVYLPRVTKVSLNPTEVVYDGHDLFETDCFYLKEVAVREAFFHVDYSRELWGMLRQRYLSFTATEEANIIFVHNLVRILAEQKPMVNAPEAHAHRTLVPHQLRVLADSGVAVLPWVATAGDKSVPEEPTIRLPLSLDETKTYDVFAFPKNGSQGLCIREEQLPGRTYRLFCLGDRLLEYGLFGRGDGTALARISLAEVPSEVAATALDAAKSLQVVFAEVSLRQVEQDNAVYVSRVDPSPEFGTVEQAYDLSVSEPLARYLIDIAR